MGVVIVINFLFYADLIIQETFLTTKPMCWDLVGIRQQILRDNGFADSVGLSVVIRMENASRNGGQDLRDLGRFVTSQCLFFLWRIISFSVLFVQPVANPFSVFNHRCRKKMKRVERRGTIESQQQREQREQYQQVQQALAIHRSQQQNSNATNPPLPPAHTDNGFHERTPSSSNVGSSLRRTDTVVVGPGMTYEHSSRTTPPPSRSEDVRTHPIPPGDSEIALHNGANGNGTSGPPREPVAVPARSDLDHGMQDASPPRVSVKGKPPLSSPPPVAAHQQTSTPNGSSKADDVQQMDTSLEEVDNDAEGEEDAEAELLEAVDAAEEAAHALREKSNGASQAEDPDDVDMKIEEEI